MPTITSLGIGSGLDVESIVSKMVALEKQPLTQLQTQQADITSKISLVGQIQSQVSALASAADKLSQSSAWSGMTLSSSDSAITGTVAGTATATSFNFSVQQMARAQSTASSALAAGTALGANGSLSITLGTWNNASPPPTFSPGAATAVNVGIDASDTVDSIATKINSANAGVTATVLNDASGQRLLVRSSQTGTAAGFRIQTTGDAALGALAFDPAAGSTGMAANAYQMGQDTQATINGIGVTSANTQIAGAIPGVTLDVSAVSTQPALITIAPDTTSMRKNINDFVASYNSLSKTLTDATKYDETNKTAGPMQGDSAIVGMQFALRQLLGSSSATGGAFSRLADVGLDMQQGGVLTTNSKLDTAMGNLGDLQKLFTADSTDTASSGFGVKIKAFAQGLLDASGTVGNESSALQSQLQRNAEEQDKVDAHAAAFEKQLRAQYSALDGQMAQLNALNSYVTQQLAAWNKA